VPPLIYYVGAKLFNNDEENWSNGQDTDLGDIVMLGFQLMIAAISNGIFLPFLLKLANSKAAASRVQKRIKKNKKYDGDNKPTELRGEVVFENVEFSYPTKKNHLIL